MHRVVALASCVTIAWLCYRRRQLQRLQELDAGQRSEDPSMADEATYQSTADQSANQSLATRRVKQKVPRRQMLEGKGRGPSNPLRDSGLEQEVVFEFDVNEYDFRGCLQDILDIAPGEALHLLHENDDSLAFIEASNATQFSPKKRPPKIDDNAWPAAPGRHKNPFLRRWKRVWSGGDRDTAKVEALKRFEELLLRFNREFCAPRMGSEPCLFQQINWWMPISNEVFGHNTLYVESEPGKKDFHPLNLKYGQVCRFYGNKCMHYCVPNDTDVTRVSLDFRTIPISYYDETYTHLPSGDVVFRKGTYYRCSDD